MRIAQFRTEAASAQTTAAPPVAAQARPAALDHSPRMQAQRAAIDAAFGSAAATPVPSVTQLKPKYALLAPQADFTRKHLNANPSPELCSAMLVARKYRGWMSVASAHTLIDSAVFPGAWQVPAIGAGNKTTNQLTVIERQDIASDPAEVTAGSDWTVSSKRSARNPAVGGNVVAVAPVQGHNGAANVPCSWSMAVNHLAGAEDQGTMPTTVHWNGVAGQYTVKAGMSAAKTFAKATVEP